MSSARDNPIRNPNFEEGPAFNPKAPTGFLTSASGWTETLNGAWTSAGRYGRGNAGQPRDFGATSFISARVAAEQALPRVGRTFYATADITGRTGLPVAGEYLELSQLIDMDSIYAVQFEYSVGNWPNDGSPYLRAGFNTLAGADIRYEDNPPNAERWRRVQLGAYAYSGQQTLRVRMGWDGNPAVGDQPLLVFGHFKGLFYPGQPGLSALSVKELSRDYDVAVVSEDAAFPKENLHNDEPARPWRTAAAVASTTITLDRGAGASRFDEMPTVFALLGHNLDGAAGDSVYISYSDSAGGPYIDFSRVHLGERTMPDGAADWPRNGYAFSGQMLQIPSGTAGRYIRLTIVPAASKVISIGELHLGVLQPLNANYLYGYRRQLDFNPRVVRTDYGQRNVQRRAMLRDHVMSFSGLYPEDILPINDTIRWCDGGQKTTIWIPDTMAPDVYPVTIAEPVAWSETDHLLHSTELTMSELTAGREVV